MSANRLLPEAEYEASQVRSPLKSSNTQGNVPTTPKMIMSTASTFMTPITPSQLGMSPSDSVMEKALHTDFPQGLSINHEDKENSGKHGDTKSKMCVNNIEI